MEDEEFHANMYGTINGWLMRIEGSNKSLMKLK